MLCESVNRPYYESDVRSSLQDEDWIESNFNRNTSNHPFGAGTGAQLREWRPQTTVNSMTTTQIGFSTASISPNINIVGLGNLNSNASQNGMTTGFISSREALSLLPAKQFTTHTNPKKRKSNDIIPPKEKPSQPRQATLKTWITKPIETPPPPKIKVRSSGIIQDRGKSSKNVPGPAPLQQFSSPPREYDIDALPSVSFSSPNCPAIEEDDFCSPLPKPVKRYGVNDIPTSPLAPPSHPVKVDGLQPHGTAPKLVIKDLSTGKKSLGMRGGMKPWPSKKTF